VSGRLLSGCGASALLAAAALLAPGAGAGASADAKLPPCVPAQPHRGAPPAWTDSAWSAGGGPSPTGYALSTNGDVAAFFEIFDLRAGNPQNPANKVLWIVRYPRDNHPLTIAARSAGDRGVTVRSTWPADSSPGEIYPSAINLPRAGCWTLALAWGSHRATIDVAVRTR
jgi:hypothetical protein